MLLTVDRFGNPFILAESMTIFVRGENKIYINDVTMNTKMLTQIVEYILEQSWSPGMTLTEKLFEAIVHGSMAKDYQFTQANVKGCGSFAAWRIFDMPMFEHAFFTYGIEIYITEARELGDLETVVTFLGPFSREELLAEWNALPYCVPQINPPDGFVYVGEDAGRGGDSGEREVPHHFHRRGHGPQADAATSLRGESEGIQGGDEVGKV